MFLLTSIFSIVSFAECDKEKSELEGAQGNCNNAIAASVAVTTGGAIAIPIFGGLIFGAQAALVAKNQCRIRDEKQNNLSNCELNFRNEQATLAAEMQARAAKILEVNRDYDQKVAEATQQSQSQFNAFIEDLQKEGYDLTAPNIAEEIEQDRTRLGQELQKTLAVIEHERWQALGLEPKVCVPIVNPMLKRQRMFFPSCDSRY